MALELIDGLDDATLAARPDAVVNLAAAELYIDRFADSARHAERALGMARATGHGQHLPTLHACLSTAWSMHGRLKDAADLLDGALEAARLRDDDQGLAWMLFNRTHVAISQGDLDTAVASGRESHELAQRIEGGLISGWAGFWYGSALVASGEPARGIEVMLEACGGEEMPLIPGGWRVTCLDGLSRARIEVGRLDDARRSARLAQELAAQMPLPLARAMGQIAGARMALADGDAAAAVEPALAAAEACRSVGALAPAASAQVLAGRALGEAGERERAVSLLQEAATALEEFGALRERDAVDQALRRLGARVQRRSRGSKGGDTGIASLTERELEVANLIVERLTNKEIARRLFLSEKTIETHIRNVFVKLGVTSRVQVARAMESAERIAARAT